MKKLIILSSALIAINATEISTLFEAIKKIPESKIDNIAIKEMQINKNKISSSLYPKLNIFSSFEHFSSPANIKPQPPTTATKLAKEGKGFWFSQNITKIGFSVSMPLFVKEIFDNSKKLKHIVNIKKYQAKINLLKREALLVTYLSKLNYLYSLKDALNQKEKSIKTTLKAIKTGVEVGRIPEFKLLRLKDALNSIQIKKSQINMAIDDTKSKIYELTKKEINSPVNFETLSNIEKKEFLAIKPLKENLKAQQINLNVSKDSYYPKFMIEAKGYRAFAKAYNNDDNLAENFASIGVYMNWNVFDKTNNADIQKAKISLLKSNLEIKKTIKNLNAEVKKIKESLKEINKSIILAQNSIELKEELLKSAKTAFELNNMTVDEYLDYENDLANAKANLADLIATKNTLIANLAFIYGNNLERIFK